MENISSYKSAIRYKLRLLEKKFAVSYRSITDSEKRIEIQKYITVLENLSRKLEAETLQWDDLQKIGITKKNIFELSKELSTPSIKTDLNDFEKISTIDQIEFIQENFYQASQINTLFSIIEFININYQNIFTQKILISASKTNSLRELFYMQYQEILHIFNSYREYAIIPSTSELHVKMLDKEYIQLLKAILQFLNSIQNYIELIFQDDTFTATDFAEPIKTTDKKSYIFGLTLKDALLQCNEFIEESINYLQSDNKEIFDHISMNSKFNK